VAELAIFWGIFHAVALSADIVARDILILRCYAFRHIVALDTLYGSFAHMTGMAEFDSRLAWGIGGKRHYR